MESLQNLLGIQLGLPARFIIAFVFVLILIALTAWIIRRVASGRGGFGGALRAKQDRLAVVDAAHIDAKRRLVLVRRDHVEHLLLIGGPVDVVVEENIIRNAATDLHGRGTRPRRINGDEDEGEIAATEYEPPVSGLAPAVPPGPPLAPVHLGRVRRGVLQKPVADGDHLLGVRLQHLARL